MAVKDWSTVAASNTSVGGVSIAEGMSPAGVNNAMRAMMADVATNQGAIVAAPDYASLAAAVAAAGAYGTVLLQGNTYTLTTGITLSTVTDITIQGPGLITTAQDIVSLTLHDCERIRVKDVRFVSSAAAPSTATAISCDECLTIWIDNCDFDGHLIGVHSADSTDQHEIYVNMCLIQTTDIAGSIGIRSVSGDNVFTNNIIRGYETGISVERGTHLIYHNHIYKAPSASYNYSIDLKPFGAYGVNNQIIIGNQFDNPAAAAIRFEDCDNIWEVVIIGNLFYLWQFDIPAILFDGAGTLIDTVIRNNQFDKAGAALTTTIDPGTATLGNGVIIDQNTFTNCPDYATEEHFSTFESGATTPLVLDSMPAGAGAAFDIVGLKTRHKNDASAIKVTGDIAWALQDATGGAENVDIRFDAMIAGTLTEVGRFRGTAGNTQGLRIGTGGAGEGAWNTHHLQMGPYHFWMFNNKLYFKSGAPSAEDDGTVIGP